MCHPQNPAWGLPDIKTWRRNSLAHRTAREAIPQNDPGVARYPLVSRTAIVVPLEMRKNRTRTAPSPIFIQLIDSVGFQPGGSVHGEGPSFKIPDRLTGMHPPQAVS